ncbi:RsiV family protein [Bacillus badius]|uniref:DUF3298 and DUF4163 domain-containing protein n=1 Tax=Bacillus badius TaxID=1455 RepID=UPI001CBB509B|nr:RsiV family protein [Bacillus badius]MED0667971.1 RsiV family protein [Bacillus badius]UAT33032.1 DUF3298 and DUF4163 domain-containing protein [Bacillus badius]
MDKRLEMLRKDYKDIPIPKELDRIVAQALQEKPKKKKRPVWPASVAAAALLFTATVNFSPEAAQAMSKIPLVKELVEVVTFNEFKEEKGNASIDVKTPAITGLDNQALEDNLNQKYVEESQKLYEEFAKSAAAENGHFSMNSEYEKVTESPEILSVRRTIQRTQASGYIQNRYVTIDKENEVLITLKGLFKNGQYVPVISENIKEQMKQQMAADPNKIYWVSENEIEPFTQINPDQPFYINQDHKLVISFDEYEAAPGYMGPVEFIIPTAVISDLLVGERYIR